MHFGRDRFRGQNNGLGLAGLISVSIIPELSMGPFCVTRSNSTQPNPLQVEKLGPNSTQPNTTNKFNFLMQPNFIQPCFKCTHTILSKF